MKTNKYFIIIVIIIRRQLGFPWLKPCPGTCTHDYYPDVGVGLLVQLPVEEKQGVGQS